MRCTDWPDVPSMTSPVSLVCLRLAYSLMPTGMGRELW